MVVGFCISVTLYHSRYSNAVRIDEFSCILILVSQSACHVTDCRESVLEADLSFPDQNGCLTLKDSLLVSQSYNTGNMPGQSKEPPLLSVDPPSPSSSSSSSLVCSLHRPMVSGSDTGGGLHALNETTRFIDR